MILWWIQRLNELEVQGNSLERIEKYTDIEQEPTLTEGGKPPAYWPSSGKLEVENLSARYSPDGPKVLQGISFSIMTGERIGIGAFLFSAHNTGWPHEPNYSGSHRLGKGQ